MGSFLDFMRYPSPMSGCANDRLATLVEVSLPRLKDLISRHGVAKAFHHCGMCCHHLDRQHSFDLVLRRSPSNAYDKTIHLSLAGFVLRPPSGST